MPAGIVLHVGDILALNGLHNDGSGLALGGLCGLHSLLDGIEIVAVDGLHMEAESLQLVHDGVGAHNIGNIAVDLQAVVVDDDAQVIQLIVGGEHERLPALAFLDLAVTQQGVNTVGLAGVLGSQRHAAGGGNALAQGAGGHIHTGNGVHIGVALQIAVDMAQGLQILHGEETAMGQRGVQAGCGMALTQDKTVPVLPLGILGIDIHFLEVQIGEHFGSGQAAAGVAAFGTVSRFDDAHANLAGGELQLLLFAESHSIASLRV